MKVSRGKASISEKSPRPAALRALFHVPTRLAFAAPANAEPSKFPWLDCRDFHSTGIPVVLMHLKPTPFVTEERTWEKTLCGFASNA